MSDQFIVDNTTIPDVLIFIFISDPAIFLPGGAGIFVESGSYQNMFDGGAGAFASPTRLIIDARSDSGDSIEGVPQPATLALVGFSLAGLACYRWKRRDA